MRPYRFLLAKGWNPAAGGEPPANVRLLPHLRAVEAAAIAIVEATGAAILANMALDATVWFSRLRLALRLSALCHDLGKANSYFQGMVRGKADFPPTDQPIRHELLSVLILLRNTGGVRDWLRREITDAGEGAAADKLIQTIIGAVAGHHVKMDEEWSKALHCERVGGGGAAIDLYLGHADLAPLFGAAAQPADETWPLLKSQPAFPGKSRIAFNNGSVEWQDFLDANPEWKRFAAAVKALTVAADVAGSALLPEGVAIKRWVTHTLEQRAAPEKLAEVAKQRLAGRPERPFQTAIANTPARITLVEAGCGSGKTAAAWAWAAKRAQGRKIFFCYPTTGTATEGFLDYVADSPVEGKLIHSRAAVDLERVATSREDDHEDAQLRIESLKAWAPEAVICTIDTVLALVRNNRRGLYGSPAILSAAFVFDELHAYDDTLFAAVIALIRALPGAPFLLMSASLPAQRRQYLCDQLGAIGRIAPPTELESLPRYHLRQTDAADALAQAVARVRTGGRVLWVCNVVARAQAVFEQAQHAGTPVAAYHSRFRYLDRVEHHRKVVDGFAAPAGAGLLAVTTQVAEMSLNLDADLLVTEQAPIPALIQRLGRLNRRVSESNPGTPRLALVIPPENNSPYEPDELAVAQVWLKRLPQGCAPSADADSKPSAAPPSPAGGGAGGEGNAAISVQPETALSQRDLAECFQAVADASPLHLEQKTEWVDSGWNAWPGKIRDAGFSVNVILPEDAEACRQNAQEIIKRCLPMPYKSRMESWATLRGAFLAPPDAIHYDQRKGATWAD